MTLAGHSRVALVSGGASGIGAEVARTLAADGHRVVVADLNCEGAARVAEALPGTGHLAMLVDVSDADSVSAVFEASEKVSGPLAVLVNAAGILLTQPGGGHARFWESGLDRWERSMAVNARGSFLMAAEFVRRRAAKPVDHARIVLFSSIVAQSPLATTFADYAASKSAVLGFMRAAARECAALRITVNAVSPGRIDTPMNRSAIPNDPGNASNIPLGRVGQPADVAALIRFVVSPEADFITGATFDVNGGQRMQ